MDIWQTLYENSSFFSHIRLEPRDLDEVQVEEISQSLREDTEHSYYMGFLLGDSCENPRFVAIPMEMADDETPEIDDLRSDFWTGVLEQAPIRQVDDPSLSWTLLGSGYVLIHNPYFETPFATLSPDNEMLKMITRGRMRMCGNLLVVKVSRSGALDALSIDDHPSVMRAITQFATALNALNA
ncbi:hypothetical protein NP233_g5547 [Leucocoprinus birnbaumii]|uniref:Uncharacterized protein n=1 Tax=Leucocoprinus birnbaumii TaxID=56174 RepID=A0AAD5VTW8_9AGAR|nr:hypothetical protein NP233_g5547 [Leucocoprinus birnbaumii]